MKVKTHRGESLNEGADDLAEVGRLLVKEGEGYRWKQRTTRLVFSYSDRISSQWKKDTWSRTIRNTARRGEVESLLEERLIEKVRRNKDRTSGGDSTAIDVGEVEKSFWFSRPDGWVVNRKMKKIIVLEFKRTDDYSESYYQDM